MVQNVKEEGRNGSNVEASKEKKCDSPKVEMPTRVIGSDCETNKVETLVQRYSDVFYGLGKLKGFQVHLHVDKEVQPIKSNCDKMNSWVSSKRPRFLPRGLS